ncbi:MAG: hypothetical protein IJE74_02805 [Clostridia bacterium]|nr:hypothetical protein [Clostridia bacterium]
MKNREEYQASIFAKRNALLQKRKKRISQAAAGTGIAVCFAAAFIIIPQLPGRIVNNNATTSALTASEHEEMITEQNKIFVEENLTFCTNLLIGPYTKPTHENFQATAYYEEAQSLTNDVTVPAINSEAEIDEEITVGAASSEETTKRKDIFSFVDGLIHMEPEIHTEAVPPPDSGEDNILQEYPDTGSDNNADENAESSNSFTTEEIITAAIGYLSDEHKEFVDPETAYVTVTKTSQGDEYYEIWFDINGTNHKIRLDSETLEPIAVNSEKSQAPATTAALPYIPD